LGEWYPDGKGKKKKDLLCYKYQRRGTVTILLGQKREEEFLQNEGVHSFPPEMRLQTFHQTSGGKRGGLVFASQKKGGSHAKSHRKRKERSVSDRLWAKAVFWPERGKKKKGKRSDSHAPTPTCGKKLLSALTREKNRISGEERNGALFKKKGRKAARGAKKAAIFPLVEGEEEKRERNS